MLYIIAHLHINPGQESEFRAFEKKALKIFQAHGGVIIGAFNPDRPRIGLRSESSANTSASMETWESEVPYEIHVLSIPSEEAFEAYRNDPGFLALSEERARVIRKTVIFNSRMANLGVFKGITLVTNDIRCESLAHLETQIKMGFKEGYSAGLDNLDELLARLKKGK